MNMNAARKELSEAQMVQLVRNALLVAGQEMGAEGDHWPAIKATIRDVMKDWDELQTERAVQAEMQKHLYAQLEEMERILETCDAAMKAEAGPKLKELREVYDAYFSPADDEDELVLEDIEAPMHVKRAEQIIGSLEEEDE
jgi:hypothetical protein